VTREEMLSQLADRITGVSRLHPIRVAIDGVDASGKTTLANELIQPIERRGRRVIRASVDSFHRPRAERLRQGPESPAGYYADSFDYAALRKVLLLPLGPRGSRWYRRAVFDYRADAPVDAPAEEAAPDSVLLLDGVFLLRPELDDCWDFRVFVDVAFAETLRRACARGIERFGSAAAAAVRQRYQVRYIPGQRIYLAAVRPRERADVVVENGDLSAPRLLVRSPSGELGSPSYPG
jgi:uridine kinase